MRLLVLLALTLLPVMAQSCKGDVQVVEYKKVADGSDTVLTRFEVSGPVGATVSWQYMVHASDAQGEMHHLMTSGKLILKQPKQTVELKYTRAALKTSTIDNLSVESTACSAPKS